VPISNQPQAKKMPGPGEGLIINNINSINVNVASINSTEK
jgi:hypothetical protein